MQLHSLRVLVVDDAAGMRALVRQVLFGLSIRQVLEAGDGATALETLGVNPIDLMLLDERMPLLGGAEVIRAVRTAPDSPNPDLPIIMMTAYATRDVVLASRDAGVDALLAKPMTAGRLAKTIETVLATPAYRLPV